MSDEPSTQLTLGQQLKDARAIRHLSLEDAAVQTKIRLRHLRAIEEGSYGELPPDVFAIGFVRRYARALGLDPQTAAYVFRQERALRGPQRKRAIGFSPPHALAPYRFVLSTRAAVSLILALVVLLLFGYIWYQVRLFASPPTLTITTPGQPSIVSEAQITVTGKTTPAAILLINLEPVPLDERGAFRQDVRLTPGINTIELKATSRLGKETVETIHILYQAPDASASP